MAEVSNKRRRLEMVFHHYFLRRLGLISDEVEWPLGERVSGRGDDNATFADDGDCDGEASWRARDALTSILGRDGSTVMSDSGLTTAEMSLLDSEGGGSSASSSSVVPIASIVSTLRLWSTSDDGNNDDGGRNNHVLNIRHVRRAFDVAAYAVVRGVQRALLAGERVDVDANNVSFGQDEFIRLVERKGYASREDYDPPLLRAVEAIRIARLSTLVEASASETVPPFLKKNNTIPWFHVPVQQGTRGGVSTAAVTTASVSSVADFSDHTPGKTGGSVGEKEYVGRTSSVDIKVEKEHEKKTNNKKRCQHPDDISSSSGTVGNEALKNKRMKPQQAGATCLPEKEDDTFVQGGGKKEKKDSHSKPKGVIGGVVVKKSILPNRRTTSTSSSSSKHSPSSPTSTKPKKMARVSTSTILENASSIGGGNNATVSRTIISAAAAGVFQEFHPDHLFDAAVTDDKSNAAKLDLSTIIKEKEELENIFFSNKRKYTSQEDRGDMKVKMDEAVAQANRLSNRVLNHTKGAARRGDQRRNFRMDAALSRVGGRGGSGSVMTFFQAKSMDEEEIITPKTMKGNPFFVRPAHTLPLVTPNPFVKMMNSGGSDLFDDKESAGAEITKWGSEDSTNNQYNKGLVRGPMKPVNMANNDPEWSERCLPRLLAILAKGAGHVIVHDMQWNDRSFRVADLLANMATSTQPPPPSLTTHHGYNRNNYGPHLVVTSSGEDFVKFARVFGRLGHGLMHSAVNKGDRSNAFPTDNSDGVLLRALPYHGSKARRRHLRKHFGSLTPSPESHFSFLGGLMDSPFHVILTTYSVLVEDYAHFCQIPFQGVILDDGMSWLGCSHSDPHGKIGKVWNSGLWSNFDHGSGRAGVILDEGQISKSWDFSKDVLDDKPGNNSSGSTGGMNRIGLTARHRILIASSMHAQYRGQVYKAPVLGLLSFLAPQFTDLIRDGWEGSKVSSCKNSMAYIRTMVARLVVVYSGDLTVWGGTSNDLIMLSLKSLDGKLPLRSLNNNCTVLDDDVDDEGVDKLIKSQKIVHSRKFAAAWFQPSSSIRNELGKISLDSILAAVKKFNAIGFICEEVVTASSLTTSGAGGGVVGLSAYRPAVRCGRCFSSEQGLKHHITSMHAPPGTWLCRSCGDDCGTSQARTTHERSCGKPRGSTKSSLGGSVPTVGDGTKPTRGRKKKVVKNPVIPEIKPVEKMGGSTRVPGYKGIWAQANGSYFVQVDGKPLVDSEKETPLLFITAEAAAKKFDESIIERGNVQELEMNYRSDGSRIVHKDGVASVEATKSADASGRGASGTNPDLSVIDIKDLPPHVKPLLRDPNQTSRTGGNSKRYVYAYRGVCRQQRKGHDRWQSQISFNGTNHYLGTFDSEWDAAAVYAWAHLILYGEEATKKAQLEGEEAAAAFEKHEKDIAEGKIPPPSPSKPVKKKKRGAPRKNPPKVDKSGSNPRKPKEDSKAEILPESEGNVFDTGMSTSAHSKKKTPISLEEWNKLKTECAMMLSSGTKGTSKATILATRKDIADMSEKSLLHNISGYISSNLSSISKTFLHSSQTPDKSSSQFVPPMLIGLSASDAAWEVEKFIEACQHGSAPNVVASYSKLYNEFGPAGANLSFCTFLLSPSCTLGRASEGSQNMFLSSVHHKSTLGMPIGNLQCNIGGPDFSCSEMAAKIQYLPSKYGNFQFMACNDDDIVTLNGQRINASGGAFPLRHRDVCSVGARVFVFIERISF